MLRELDSGELDFLDDGKEFFDVVDEQQSARAAAGAFLGYGDELFEEFGNDFSGEEVCQTHIHGGEEGATAEYVNLNSGS